MHSFRVWAPDAGTVEVQVGGHRHPMEAETAAPGSPGGWWRCRVTGAGPGTEYSFVLDGGEPLPDPRSPSQPEGVFGPSRVVNPSSFAWTDSAWRGIHLPSAVVYECHVGTFSPEGTFAGVASRLDHLVSLGVQALELMPVAEFSGTRGWGYDGVDLWAPHHAYGGPDGLAGLVDACHARGIAVVMDVVYNHLGPVGNYLARFGPYFTERYSTPWGAAVNFDGPGSDGVRAFFVDNALMWLRDYHCDGLRLDAVHAIVDTSATHICEELAVRVGELANSLGRSLFVIAESDLNDPRLVRRREVGGYGLDAQWSDDFHHALFGLLTGERAGYYADFGRMADLARALRRGYVYDGRWSGYRGRTHGRVLDGVSGSRLVGYLEDHDQVGNRALGERTVSLMGEERVAVGLGLVFCAPFVPMLFQGEEWGARSPFLYFTDHADPALGAAVREGRQGEFAQFGWDPAQIPDPQDPATFEVSKLDWSEVEGSPMLEWVRRLIRLRRAWPELTDGRLDRVRVSFDEEAGWFRMERGRVSVVANLGSWGVTVGCGAGSGSGGSGSGSSGSGSGLGWRVLAASKAEVKLDGTRVSLPASSLAVVARGG
jgi:maltooligosyltrehalose trehalohydrolase